jgi:hypothetical protein
MNSVALTGVLTEDPELYEDGADPVRCRMRLAVPRNTRAAAAGSPASSTSLSPRSASRRTTALSGSAVATASA